MEANVEQQRLAEDATKKRFWKRWGPYLSERQWGTVREDYSPGGTAWEYFPHDHARSRAYRWGEDGIAGFSDRRQHICLALALWNGRDTILKERIFGLTNAEGNHGEDVKELYYYLDATPTHSYLKMLYKYPQRAFPYAHLVEVNGRRGVGAPEYELLDTGVFAEDRYFDVFVEYAKAGPEDILMRVIAHNRGANAAPLVLLPQIWFRNTWSWDHSTSKPHLHAISDQAIALNVPEMGDYELHCDGSPELIFCDNETNPNRIFGTNCAAEGYFKDAFHDYVVQGLATAVNPARQGTKAGALHRFAVPGHGSVSVRLRLTQGKGKAVNPFAGFDEIFARRIADGDEFYADLQHDLPEADARMVQRQALAGMIWSKQFYN